MKRFFTAAAATGGDLALCEATTALGAGRFEILSPPLAVLLGGHP